MNPCSALNESFQVRLGRLIELEKAEKDLKRSIKLIHRLRAENRAMKYNIRLANGELSRLENEYVKMKNYPKATAITLARLRIQKHI